MLWLILWFRSSTSVPKISEKFDLKAVRSSRLPVIYFLEDYVGEVILYYWFLEELPRGV
jgi:hypothetical protein